MTRLTRFGRARMAGAKTVVASLWKVPDAATSRLAALQEAQIFMIHDQASRGLVSERDRSDDGPLPPQYWAAFVLSGDWR